MILVFGTICIDRIRRVPRMPGSGGYVEMLSDDPMLGGEAANTALALQTWGAEVVLAGNSLGSGTEGAELEEMLRAKNLSTTYARRGEGHTPVCEVYVTPDGDRTMFGIAFSTMIPFAPPASLLYEAGEWFTAEPNMRSAAGEAAMRAHEAGMKVYVMDFTLADDPVPEGCFWQTSTDWVGQRGDTAANVAWLTEWVARRSCFGILSDGPNGFVAGSPDYPVKAYPPYPAPQILDTTGAGDMFRAGVLFGLDKGWEIGRCLQFGAVAGALKCKGLGATTYIPSILEIEAHIDAHPEISAAYQSA